MILDPQQLSMSGEPPATVISEDAFNAVSSEAGSVLAYWRRLPRNPGSAPKLEDLDLLEVAETLPVCTMLDVPKSGEYIIRLFGTELVARYGADLTGFNARGLFHTEGRQGVEARMDFMREAPAILCTKSSVINKNGLPIISEWMFLPLAGANGNVEHALLAVSVIDAPHDDEINLGGSLNDRKVLEITLATL